MADFPAPAPDSGAAAGQPPVSAGLLAYALFGTAAVIALVSSGFPLIAPLMGFVGIAGLIVAYVKRDDARGTWVASHLTWLIRTFWWSFLWGIVGGIVLVVLGIILIGIPIAFLDLGRRVDLGDLPGGPRLPAVQGQQADPRVLTMPRGASGVSASAASWRRCGRPTAPGSRARPARAPRSTWLTIATTAKRRPSSSIT